MHLLNYWLRASQSASLETSGARMHEGNNYKENLKNIDRSLRGWALFS